MAITVRVTGLDRALRGVKNAPRQIRYAATLAVNETAKALQQHTISTLLPSAFTLRSRGAPWWKPGTRYGFNIRFARRTQPEPFAILGSRADWLYLQEEGGTKTASSGRSLAVPQIGTARKSPGAYIQRWAKPANLLRRDIAFTQSGRRGRLLFTRRKKHRYPITLWYGFERSASIKPVLHFGRVEGALARRLLPLEFERGLRTALATAK